MPIAIDMPKLSDTMTEGTVVKWHKKVGDPVESGDVIAEIETDKATMDLEAFDSGFLLKIAVPEGQSGPCGSPIAWLGEKGEKVEDVPTTPSAPAPQPKTRSSTDSAPAPESPKPAPASEPAPLPIATGRVKASPLARKIAAELGVELNRLSGSGPGGRIVKKDVLAATSVPSGGWNVFPTGPVAKEDRLALTNMRKTIARRLLESKTQIPHFYVEYEIDAGPVSALRASLNAGFEQLPKPFKLSLNDFVLKAVAEAIRQAPAINASFEGDAIRQYGAVHLAFGVAIPDGLITPVIRDAQAKNLKQISDEAKALTAKARDGKLLPQEYTGGTFTVSNMGMYGVDRFSAIINPPQAAILAVGNAVKKPVVNERDEIVVGHRMALVLSADHRVVDGAVAAQFMQALRNLLENPARLLI
ncbi:MAG: pyruvate dehydrogenase complex dihydrolipoamide acetyltransferase [Candidatus Methylacidiphilales bacterium]